MMKPTQQQVKQQKKQTKPPLQRAPPQRNTQVTSQSQPRNVVFNFKKKQNILENVYLEDLQLDQSQEAMVSLIQEYLLRYNLVSTLEVLQKEIIGQGATMNNDNSAQQDIIQSFDDGDFETFIQLWNRFLPFNIRIRDEYAKKLEFNIQIYFLIYDIHPKIGKRNGQMQKNTILFFKNYLETKGAELSKTNEFLHFYALPYVLKPQEHQSYKHLFTQQWIVDLRNKLTTFLSELTSKDQPTLIEQMYQQYTNDDQHTPPMKSMSQSNNQNYTTQLEMNNHELLVVIQDYNMKYNQMQKKFKEFIDQSKATMIEAQQKWYTNAKEILALCNDV